MQTKVSMVVPCYNKVNYIDAMLQSVYNQEYDNIELILVNDGSTDGTLDKIKAWEPKFERRGFTVVTINQENMGVGMAVLNGLKCITGQYVYLPDSDDILEPQYVSHTAKILDENPSVDWVICNADTSLRHLELTGPDILPLILLNTYSIWSVCCKVVRKTYMEKCRLIENYVPARFTQEPSVNIPLAMGGSVPYLLFENLYIYVRCENSIMNSANEDFASLSEFYNGYLKLELEILKRYGQDSEKNISLAGLGIQLHLKGQLEIMINKSIVSSKSVFSNDLAYTLAEYGSLELSLYGHKKALFEVDTEFDAQFDEQYDSKVSAEYDPEFDAGFGAVMNGLRQSNGRLIICAALSRTARKVIPLLQQRGICIDFCWDNNASKKTHYGIPLSTPQYASLLDNDMIIVATTNVNIYHEIKSQTRNGYTANADYVMRKIVAIQITEDKRGYGVK